MIKCSKCGSQARKELATSVTMMHYEKGYYDADGIYHENPDPNTRTTTWKCTDCGHEYNSYTQGGKTYQLGG